MAARTSLRRGRCSGSRARPFSSSTPGMFCILSLLLRGETGVRVLGSNASVDPCVKGIISVRAPWCLARVFLSRRLLCTPPPPAVGRSRSTRVLLVVNR